MADHSILPRSLRVSKTFRLCAEARWGIETLWAAVKE